MGKTSIDGHPQGFRLGIREKLIIIFILVKIIPLILLTTIAWREMLEQGDTVQNIAVSDSSAALNDRAVENIERITTDAARRVADFLYGRDNDIQYLAGLSPAEGPYRLFMENQRRRAVKKGRWELAPDGHTWVPAEETLREGAAGVSTNNENNDMNGFHPRPPDIFEYANIPLYDEITFIDLEGRELVKVVSAESPKINYPLNPEKRNISDRANTYIKAETYFEELKALKPGEIYVSDVIGAYIGTNYIGMYTPGNVAAAAKQQGYDIEYRPEAQAYSGLENPNGQRFEGIIRWATPVTDDGGAIIGYVTMALNHDHIMEFVDHLTPMDERYVSLPNAYDGNYAFIWDYHCRSISHPRHHSIVGFDPETGDPQVPWLENSIYEGWQASGLDRWTDFTKDYPVFFEQSRSKGPAPALTKAGLVALDGRYLNFAPQCIGWMDLTKGGGSGSLYILWSGIYKLNTAAAIPYYTGHYAPSAANGYSRRGFGFVAIGAGLEFFTSPARATAEKLVTAVDDNLRSAMTQLVTTTIILCVVVIFVAIWMALFLTSNITKLIKGISRFRAGEWQFRFNAPVRNEFGTLAYSFDEMADSISNSVKHPLVIISLDQKVIYANAYALALYKKKSITEAAGIPYSAISVYPPQSSYCPLAALHENREAAVLMLEDGKQKFYIKGSASYLVDKDGQAYGYIVETNDVTEMVLRQMELESARDAAQKANQHKSEFLARMSHEIRTPMNAIIGLSGIVGKSLDDLSSGAAVKLSEVQDNTRQIETSSQHLLSLLNDILDLSKIEAGKIELSEEAVNLSRLIETVTSIIKPRCDEKNIKYEAVFDGFDPHTFLTDPLRLRQVLINLLGNAVKFTPESGFVQFSVKRQDRREGETLVEFTVSDTGIGISESALPYIFQPFEQAGNHLANQAGGTGLGLTISRHIVRLLKGDIAVRSWEGQGSVFSFSLWLRETEVRPHKLVADADGKLNGLRLLLVDDMDLNRKIVKAMLKKTGLSIEETGDGQEAVEAFERASVGHYDLILMDVLMPKMDGYQATRAIRALPRPDARSVPIVALTANAFQDDIDRAMEAGMNAHLAKPVNRESLMEILLQFLPPAS